MAPRALPLSHQLELAAEGGARHQIARGLSKQDPSGWLVCFTSFTMLLLVSWSASRPGQSLTTIIILLFLAPWGWIVLRQPGDALLSLIVNWFVLALPLLAVVSALWSDYPTVSLKGGAQFMVTTSIGIWAGSCVKPRILMSALLSALVVVAVLSVLFGSAQCNGITGECSFIGVFGSKNYFAVCVSFLLLTAVAVAFDKSQAVTFRVLGIFGAGLAAPLLLYARSVGALVTAIVTLMVTLMLRIAFRLAPRPRVALLGFIILSILGVVVVATFELDFATALDYFGKNTTLTGRTLIWQYAVHAIAAKPILGGGYEAFWQGGNWGAEEVWFYMGISSKYGLHFHNTLFEVVVDLGVVGLCLFVLLLVLITIRIIVGFFGNALTAEQLFAISLFVFLLFRMPLEVDLFFQFQLPSILIGVVWIYLQRLPRIGAARLKRRSQVRPGLVT